MTTKIVPISDLRRQASQIIQSVQEDGDVVYITQHGRPAVVLVDYQLYEAMRAQLNALLKERQEVYKAGKASTGSLLRLADMAEDLGIEDLAEQHDHYLYGVDKS